MSSCLDDIIFENDNWWDKKYVYALFKKFLCKVARNRAGVIKAQKRIVGLRSNIAEEMRELVGLGGIYHNFEMERQAFECYKRAFRLAGEYKPDDKEEKDPDLFIDYSYSFGKILVAEFMKRPINDETLVRFFVSAHLCGWRIND